MGSTALGRASSSGRVGSGAGSSTGSGTGSPCTGDRVGGLIQGAPGIQPRGVVAARGDAGGGCSSFSHSFRGAVQVGGLYRGGGAGSPPSLRRCVSPKARSSCSSWELRGRWISRCMRRVSSHCSSLLKDGLRDKWGHVAASLALSHPPANSPRVPTTHRFSGSRSQQQTAMGKKLGGQAGG